MTLKIRDGDIYSDNGEWLKKMACPKAVSYREMKQISDQAAMCRECDRLVHNTDFMSESDIVELLKYDPEACVKISIFNPIFEVDA
jgi:hypothetical protein